MANFFETWLVRPGPNRLAAISRLRQFFSLSPADGKTLLDRAPVLLVPGDMIHEAQRVARWFREVGAEVVVRGMAATTCPGASPCPFYSGIFSPSWRTSTAVALAAQMYESRDFSAMSILADALQDAGCANEDVLDHSRGPGTHVRGCWVVDLVLSKE